MSTRKYWTLTISFWLVAGVLWWMDALWIDHWGRVKVLFFYFPVIGVLLSAWLTLLYQAGWFRRLKRPLWWILLMSLSAALAMVAILNPLAYLILEVDMTGRHLEVFSRGALIHALFFLTWSLLYFHFAGRPTLRPSPAAGGDYINRISVDEGGRVRTLPVGEIECVLASGDYVEVCCDDRAFLKKETIAALEQVLDPARFSRIHRSTMVNRDKVVGIRPGGNSTYALTLESGRTVHSSRSYRSAVRSMREPQSDSAA